VSCVIEAYGGVRWIAGRRAVEMIRAASGCNENEAVDALKAWVSDGRIAARRRSTGQLTQGRQLGLTISELLTAAVLKPDPFWDFFDVDSKLLGKLLAKPKSSASGGHVGNSFPRAEAERWLRRRDVQRAKGERAPSYSDDEAAYVEKFRKRPPRDQFRELRKDVYQLDLPPRGRRPKVAG